MSSNLYHELFAIIAPVFLVASIGFVWGRSRLPFDTKGITTLVTWVGTPTLVVSTLLKAAPALAVLGKLLLVAVVIHGVMGAVAYLLLARMGLSHKAFLPSLMFGNCGNMGLPLSLFAFGQSGLALAIAFFTVSAVGMFTVGQAVAAGRTSLVTLLRTPVIWAVAVAMTLLAAGWHLPRWAANTVDLLGQLTIPLMLLTLGVSLAKLKVRSLRRSVLLSLVRIGGGMALGFAIGALFGLQGTERGVVVLQASMPVAVFNFLFAHYYDNEPSEVAGLVVVSTAISFLIMPFLLPIIL